MFGEGSETCVPVSGKAKRPAVRPSVDCRTYGQELGWRQGPQRRVTNAAAPATVPGRSPRVNPGFVPEIRVIDPRLPLERCGSSPSSTRSKRRTLSRHDGLPAGAHFGNLRPVQRLAAQPAPGVLRHAGFGTGYFPPPQAALRDPLRATRQHPRHRHHRRDRHATRLHRTRPLLALLPIAVRRISFGNAACVKTHFARNRPPEGSRHRMISRGAAPFGSETRNCIAVPPTERRLCNVECPLLNLDICRRDDRPQARVHGTGVSWADIPERCGSHTLTASTNGAGPGFRTAVWNWYQGLRRLLSPNMAPRIQYGTQNPFNRNRLHARTNCAQGARAIKSIPVNDLSSALLPTSFDTRPGWPADDTSDQMAHHVLPF